MENPIAPPPPRAPLVVAAPPAPEPIPPSDDRPPPPPPPPAGNWRAPPPKVSSSKDPPPKADGPLAPPLPEKVGGYVIPPADKAPPASAAPPARPASAPPVRPPVVPKSQPPGRIFIPDGQPQQGEPHKTSPTLDRSAPVLASPLEGEDLYVTFHRDQWQKTQDLGNQVATLTDRLNKIAASQLESHRSATAMGVDATESVSRLVNEVERLKTRLNGMENDKSGRGLEQVQTALNTISEKVKAAEFDQERMDRMETRVGEISDGFDLTEIRNQEWRDNVMKDFAELPKMTPYYRKLLQDGKDLGPVLQHLSDRQDGQEARHDNTDARVGELLKTVDSGLKENKKHFGGIQAYLPEKKYLTIGYKNTKFNSRSK
jgi:hypothetical protein